MNIIKNVISELAPIFSANEARAVAIALCEHVTGLSRVQLLSDSALVLTDEQQQQISHCIDRLRTQEPLQYVLGETEFYGLKFKVDRRVLIPRPETEELVEWIKNDYKDTACSIIDFCTGSGCIAIALAKNLSEAEVRACDLSEEALEVARENAKDNEADVRFFCADVLSELFADSLEQIDVIVSNPPYVLENEKSAMQSNVLDFEPSMALFVPDANPLLFYEAIGKIALSRLKSEGSLYVEINRDKGKETVELFRQMGFGFVELRTDLFGNARMVKAIKN
ncbi:peptide chain release factor N(5)-glutamine methyltransferase [Paludibacter sp.]|uniref:peptide chain release factor N(5)-glutamine methyltransferase n=1 Tax=Paludibacter sp. TaxID=1898105 RepID=UPI0013536B3D|nr:peptide chain release factor N(5)-glutamine methyltransferase [Paludibacter sp.]MTK53707.1 peptide chain release factor N(5)-glutamine methyltransferase [Paludibacter sp.]